VVAGLEPAIATRREAAGLLARARALEEATVAAGRRSV
jgi:hypothetical protein